MSLLNRARRNIRSKSKGAEFSKIFRRPPFICIVKTNCWSHTALYDVIVTSFFNISSEFVCKLCQNAFYYLYLPDAIIFVNYFRYYYSLFLIMIFGIFVFWNKPNESFEMIICHFAYAKTMHLIFGTEISFTVCRWRYNHFNFWFVTQTRRRLLWLLICYRSG